jgi:hypothetical protein
MDRKKFFDSLRADLFNGHLTQQQVDGMNTILAEWNLRELKDLRWLAYMLGTTYHETGGAMWPVEEAGKGARKKYGITDPLTGQVFYGRGYIQLTWKYNYIEMSAVTGRDLVNHPEEALIPEVAAEILIHGMVNGTFTGRKLSQYFSKVKEDWVNARRIVNGNDKANLIASYGRLFLKAIKQPNV